jgi:hypothetical protein
MTHRAKSRQRSLEEEHRKPHGPLVALPRFASGTKAR